MELTVKKEDFLEVLALTQSVVEKKTTLAVLSNVKLTAGDQSLTVSATDLEIGFEGVYPAMVKKTGSVTVPAKKLYEIVRELPSEDVYIHERDNNWVYISGGEAKFNLFGLPADDFPGLPEFGESEGIEVSAAKLKRMIQCTIFSTSSEDTMYNTSGVFLEKTEEEGKQILRMVTTDGHRLSIMEQEVEGAGSLDIEGGVVISKKGINEIHRMIDSEKNVKINFSERVGVVRTENNVLAIRLLENKFPDYKRVIPDSSEYRLTVKRIPLQEMLRRMSVLYSERYKAVRLDIKPGILEIYSTNPELGDAQERKEVIYQGPEMSVGFNPRYLMEVLSVMESEDVQLTFNDANSGCVILGEADKGFLGLVMPMKIS